MADESRFAATLEDYRRAKRAVLSDEGPDALRHELAMLETWIAKRDAGGDGWWGEREMEVDVDFRRAKVRVLRELLGAP